MRATNEQIRMRKALGALPFGASIGPVPEPEKLNLETAAAWLEDLRGKLKEHSEKAQETEHQLDSVTRDLRAVGRLLVRALPELAEAES